MTWFIAGLCGFLCGLLVRRRAAYPPRASAPGDDKLLTCLQEIAIVSITDPHGTILEVNDAFCTISGYRRQELIGQNHRIINSQQHPPEFWQQMWASILAGRPWRAEVCNRRKDGTHYWVDTIVAPLKTNDGSIQRVLSLRFDISHRKEVEHRYKEQHQRLEEVLRGTNAGTWEWHIPSGATVFNERWAHIVGYTLEELAPISIETWNRLVHPEDKERSAALLEEHFRGDSAQYDCECRMRHKDGTWVWVHDRGQVVERDAHGNPLRMSGTHLDITLRKHTEDELQRSQRQFQSLVENIPGTSYRGLWDSQSTMLYMSTAIDQLSGHPASDFIGNWVRSYTSIIHPQDSAHRQATITAAVEQQRSWELEYRILHADGTTHWAWERGSAAYNAQREAAYLDGFILDITQRRQAEQALHDKSLELERYFESSLDLLSIADIDGRFIRINPQWTAMLGYPADSLIGKPFLDLVHEDDVANTMEAVSALTHGNHVYSFTNRCRCANGSFRVLEWQARPLGHYIYAVARDITTRAQEEQERQRLAEALAQTNSVARVGGWEVNLEHNTMWWSPVTKEIHGVAANFAPDLETAIQFYSEGESREKITHAVHQAIEHGTPWEIECQIQTLKGERRWVRAMGRAERRQGVTVRLYGAFQDIQQQKENEAALRKAQHDAEAANKAKSQFLANMSHEIRTPMNGVMGMLELLMHSGLHSKQLELARTAYSSSEALLRIINDILDFSKIEADRMTIEQTSFDLLQLAHEVADLFRQPSIAGELSIFVHYHLGTPQRVLGDPLRVRQILSNLVGNAVKFTKQGHVLLSVSQHQHEIHISVEDTGIGINPERLPDLFNPFTQADDSTSRTYGGTGLGLAISRRLAELMGGHLSARSTVGAGSCFTLHLPLVSVETSGTQTALPEDSAAQGLRIALWAAHPVEERILREQLGACGAHLQDATQAKTAQVLVCATNRSADPLPPAIGDLSTRLPTLRIAADLNPGCQSDQGVAQVHLRQGARPQDVVHALHQLVHGAQEPATKTLRAESLPRSALRGHVLLVEDNRVNQHMARLLLEHLGLQVDIASNGREALQRVQEGNYALLLMDCQMPEMDGYAATAAIRQWEQSGRRHPIIAMTANALSGDRERCLAAGMDDYVTKPIQGDILYRLLARWLPEDETTKPTLPQAAAIIHQHLGPALAEIASSDPHIAQMIIDTFCEDLRASLAQEPQIETNTLVELRSWAHKIKGAAASVGAEQLSTCCAQLEYAARDGDRQTALANLPLVRQHAQAYLDHPPRLTT